MKYVDIGAGDMNVRTAIDFLNAQSTTMKTISSQTKDYSMKTMCDAIDSLCSFAKAELNKQAIEELSKRLNK